MDHDHFDALARKLAAASRRGLLARLGTGLLATTLLAVGRDDAAAKPCPPCRKKKRGKCKKKRPDGTPCGGGKVCRSGRCACPIETEPCGGSCVPLCDLFEARNPLTCGCCTPRNDLLSCDPANNDCCSGICRDLIVFHRCGGRAADQPCDFDAQCDSFSCVGGQCAAS